MTQHQNPSASIVVIGLGDSGISCVDYFVAKHIHVVVMDSRESPPQLAHFKAQYPHIPVYTGGFAKEILAKSKTLVVSPGISRNHPDIVNAILPGTEIIGDIELFARELAINPTPLVAITGSNGKSTVTTLVGEMAKAADINVAVGGNIGTPALSLLKNNPELFVLELSSFQLETTYSLESSVATILNCCPDHMDRYTTFEDYLAAKYRIFNHAQQIVFNRDDAIVSKDLPLGISTVSFGLDLPLENNFGLIKEKDQYWLAKGREKLLTTSEMKLFGRHNIANALAALALGDSVQIPMPAMLSALKTFTGLPHRCEWVREYQGVQWINDSKGTNVGATAAALQGLSNDIQGKWILIAGGLGKNADFSVLSPLIAKYCRTMVLIGEAAQQLEELFAPIVNCVKADNMVDAVYLSLKHAEMGDGVLLSPACASFDMYKNFEERGNIFRTAVLQLK